MQPGPRFSRSRWWAAPALALLATLGACASGDRPAAALELEPCKLESDGGLQSVEAECAALSVPEDRNDPSGRTIELRVAVVRALSRDAASDPLFVLAGGPGQAATQFYAAYAPAFSRVQRTRDIVLVDQRGTGGSNALRCGDALDPTDALETLDPAQLRARAEQCLRALPGDPRHYTTSIAVQDLDEVRAALGYPHINLYGVSYGTRVAQHYLRRYPVQVRALVLDGAVPPEIVLGPDTSPEAQRTLDAILDRCQTDPRCAAAFPDVVESFTALLARVRQDPLALSVPDPTTARPVEMSFGVEQFGAALRLLSYSDETAAMLPLLLHAAAAEGHPEPLAAQFLMVARSLGSQLAEGMHNAVVCTEDVPFIDAEATATPAITDGYLGTLQLEGLAAICAIWPHGALDQDLHAPLRIDVPLLLLSGELDPITPPRYAEQILAQASDALHVVLPGHGHGQLADRCVSRLLAEFIASRSPQTLDPACAHESRPAPFFLDFTGTAP